MDVSSDIELLCRFLERHDFAGYDPYDALNSPIVRFLSFGQKYGRIAWIQFLRRFPVNIRYLLLTPEGHNPKALGLFLGGYTRLCALDRQPKFLMVINQLLELLEKTRSQNYSGACWGYNFDWQNRTFLAQKYTPTIVNSSFVGHALLDAWEILGHNGALDLACSIKDFILQDLNRTVEKGTFCFSYTPNDFSVVHNANLLGAALLIRLYKETGEPELKDIALASLAFSMNHQLEDGSWYYGETKIQKWIDSFHTGFNLEAIRYFIDLGEGAEYLKQYNKGRDYYASNFFLDDGTPKYYNDKVFPIDIHAPAEAVTFFSREGTAYSQLSELILSWMINNMWDKKGYFYFRKTRMFTNKIPYMRWGQAWGFRALTEYEYSRKSAVLNHE